MALSKSMTDSVIKMIIDGVKENDYFSEAYDYIRTTDDQGEEVPVVINKGGYGCVYKARAIAEHTKPNEDEHPSRERAVKVIDLKFENDYKIATTTTKKDRGRLKNFLQCCQEAILQEEVFDHPHVVKIYDKWIQRSPKAEESYIIAADDLSAIIDYLKQTAENEDNVPDEFKAFSSGDSEDDDLKDGELSITAEVQQALRNMAGK